MNFLTMDRPVFGPGLETAAAAAADDAAARVGTLSNTQNLTNFLHFNFDESFVFFISIKKFTTFDALVWLVFGS